MKFSIDLGAWNSIFAVPSDIVDKHIKLAGESQLKVLLIMLRYNGEGISTDKIAEILGFHETDVNDAIQYWTDNKILRKITDNKFVPNDEQKQDKIVTDKPKSNSEENQKVPSRPISRRYIPDSITLSKRMEESDEIKFLMQEAQIILGKTLSNGDSAILLTLLDTDGLPPEVIIMILQYAVSIGKPNIRYIEKIGISWADEGINSLEDAELKIRSLKEQSNAFSKVQKITGVLPHSPTAKELSFCQKWINEWHFSDNMIREAYERTIDTIGKFTYSYANGILSKWYKNNIKTIKDIDIPKIQNQDKSKKKKSSSSLQNFSSKATYDLEAFSKKSIFDD